MTALNDLLTVNNLMIDDLNFLDLNNSINLEHDEMQDQNIQDENKISWEQIVQLSEDKDTNVFLLPDGDNTELFEILNIQANDDQIIIIENINEIEEIKNVAHETNLIDENLKIQKPEVPKKIHPPEHSDLLNPPCLKQLTENNKKLQLFLKNQIKIDIKIDEKHDCKLCDRVFVHASGLKKHNDKHRTDIIPNYNSSIITPNQAVIYCLICGQIYSNANTAIHHVENDHHQIQTDESISTNSSDNDPEDPNKTPILTWTTSKINSLKSPVLNEFLKSVLITSAFQCEFCTKIFGDIHFLMHHQNSHDPSNGYECRSCEIKVSTMREIFIHWKTECIFNTSETEITIQKYFACNICFDTFKTIDKLYEHRYTNAHFYPRLCILTGKLKANCEICGLTFTTAKFLLDHQKEKHSKKGSIKIPEPIVKIRQFLCDVCGKSYTQSSHLWQHLRFHQGVKPFACSVEGCTRKFTIRPDLNDHIRKCHTGERPYQCLVCGKRFLTGSVYYQHRLIHRGERRYGCDECGKRFYRADALKNHMRIHTGEKPYPCEYCSKSFRQRGDKDKHVKARHSAFNNQNAVIYVGQVPFPQSMFQPLMCDIDKI